MKRDPQMKICYDRIIPFEENSPDAVLHKMHEDAVLNFTGAKMVRKAFIAKMYPKSCGLIMSENTSKVF